ncbi:MAG: hypothetical protein LUD12_00065 [Lachnospiraceae bacterium]|nr:hypothetical protein [Lachnospiraceae bacterium]
MLKEYIKDIQTENDMKLNSLQQEMQDLVNDLDCNEKVLEKLQHDKKIDTNIFSPRTIDLQADDKIEETQNKINGIKRRMEYVSQMIDEAMKQKKELHLLKEEAENYTSAEYRYEQTNKQTNDQTNEQMNDQKNNSSPVSLNNDKNNDIQSDMISLNDLNDFLSLIYKKIETSLALVNGNKNRCKTELRSAMTLIKDYAKKLENLTD